MSAEEVTRWTDPTLIFEEPSQTQIDQIQDELDALVERHFLEKTDQGEYTETGYAVWAVMCWQMHYRGVLLHTAQTMFGIENPILRPDSAIFYKVTEADLGKAFDITDDDEAAYAEALAELEAKRREENHP